MSQSIERSPLFRVANPRSIAFYGASSRTSSMGSMILSSVIQSGFKGAIYPVHPTETEVQGYRAYHHVSDIEEIPDLAIFVLHTNLVEEMLEQCGKKGIRHAVIVSGGFKEVGGEGVEREQRLLEIATTYGISVIGPNCLGIANTHQRVNSTPFPLEGDPGFIGLVSQSGSFVTQMYDYLSRISLGFSTAFSVGNELNVDLVDCMEYLGACPDTKVIALYIEGIKRGGDFIRMARSIVPNKPIVAYYVGGSETGRRAAFSHTGSLSGPDEIYDGVFKQCGVIRAFSVTELFDYCWALGQSPRIAGNRVVIQTHSGGPGAVAADACGRLGLELPSLSEETKRKLEPFLPHTASVNNPIDLTFTRNTQDFLLNIPHVLLREPRLDILLIYLLLPEKSLVDHLRQEGLAEDELERRIDETIDLVSQAVSDLTTKFGKPIIGFTFRGLEEKIVKGIIKRGIPVFPDPKRAAKAINAMVRYYDNALNRSPKTD